MDDAGFIEASKRLNDVLTGVSTLALSDVVKKRASKTSQ